MAGDGDEGSKARRQDLEKGGLVQDASGDRNQTSLGIHQQEAGGSSGVGDPAENIRGL